MKSRVLVLLFSPLFLRAQTSNTDSLKKVVLKDPSNYLAWMMIAEQLKFSDPDSMYRICLKVLHEAGPQTESFSKAQNELGNYFFSKSNADSALFYYRKNISSAAAANKVKATALANTGLVLLNLRQEYKPALDTLLLAEKMALAEKDKSPLSRLLYNINANVAEVYRHLGIYDKSVEYAYHAEKYINTEKDSSGYCTWYLTLGNIQYHFGELKKADFSKAIECYRKGLELCKRYENKVNLVYASFNLANAFLAAHALDSAQHYARQCQLAALPLSDSVHYYLSFHLLGEIDQEKGMTGPALQHLSTANAGYARLGLRENQAEALISLGKIYDTIQKYNEAALSYRKALSIYRETESLEGQKKAYLQLALNATKRNDFREASLAYENYIRIQQELFGKEQTLALVASEVKYETSLKESVISGQRKEIRFKEKQNKYLLTGAALLSVVALLFWFLYKRIKRQKLKIDRQKEEILHNHRNNIQQLISIFNRQAAAEELKENARENQERLMTLNLLNEMLYKNESSSQGDLKEYLEKLAKAKQIASPVKAEIEVDSNPLRLKPNLLKDVGLIVNELITNAYKYAFASQPQPRIRVYAKEGNPGQLHLRVTDNGIGLPAGFNLDIPQASFGLGFVQDLVAQHHGRIKAESQNGSLFDIELRIR